MPKTRRINFDTAAATPLDPAIKREMNAYLRSNFANPSGLHQEGVAAARELANARARVAAILGAHSDEIVFTSGGTEANNLAVFGVVEALESFGHAVSKSRKPIWTWRVQMQVVTSAIEHASVLGAVRVLEGRGVKVSYLSVNREGLVNQKKLKTALNKKTKLVSIIYAHNEIGVVQPIREIAKIIRHHCKRHGTVYPYLHIDACQAPRFLDINVARLGVDLMTINAGKIYGPRGIGALYVRRGVELGAQSVGGSQEGGRRAGTENVAGAIGLAGALEICAKEREKEAKRLSKLRDQLIAGLLKIDGVELNGPLTERLPNNVNIGVGVPNLESEQVVIELDAQGIACSTGAACSIPKRDGSYVIMALGRDEVAARNAIRFTLGREATSADVRHVLKSLIAIFKKYVPSPITKI
ncbi:MAG: cysteine desulfurase family protein [Patescibacteria group bacterium]|nr:cysteine desulfurase family protein [Patescibacteria group bacterium]